MNETSDMREVFADLDVTESSLALTDASVPLVLMSATGKVDGFHNNAVPLNQTGPRQFSIVVPKRAQGELKLSSVVVRLQDGSTVELQTNTSKSVGDDVIFFSGSKIEFVRRKFSSDIEVKIQKVRKSGDIELGSASDVCSNPNASFNEDTGILTISVAAGPSLNPVNSFSQYIENRDTLLLNSGEEKMLENVRSLVWSIDAESLGVGTWQGVFKASAPNQAMCEMTATIVIEEEVAGERAGSSGTQSDHSGDSNDGSAAGATDSASSSDDSGAGAGSSAAEAGPGAGDDGSGAVAGGVAGADIKTDFFIAT